MTFSIERSPFRIRLAAVAALLVLAAGAQAGPRVTVYSQDLGFVRETRTLALAGSPDTVRLADVSERLDFASVRLAPADASARVGRLAYRYDVASGDGLVDHARGSRVRVSSRGDRVTEGTLVAADGSWLVVRADDGSIHTVARGAVEDVRLANPPASLSLRPTIEAVIEGGRRGNVEAELSYLTGGLSWSAEHVLVKRGESAGVWSTRVTVENQTGRDYADATLKLVAGQPNRAGGLPSPMPMRAMMAAADGAEAKMSEESFADYHLYTLSRPATLRDRETQSLGMLEARDVGFTPRYLYRGGDPRGVRTQLELRNVSDKGLGVPLPAGRVRVFEADAKGDLQFTGEASIGHTAEGEKFTLDVGRAFDLSAERREVFNKKISDRERQYQVEVKLRNAKKNDVTIAVEEGVGGDYEVTQQSHPSEAKDANTLRWSLPVPAGKEAILTYTVRVRY
jgi:hypothetical protein